VPSGTSISADPNSCAVASFEYGRPNIRSVTSFFITEFRLKSMDKALEAGDRMVFVDDPTTFNL
jgi:hypothetical protein